MPQPLRGQGQRFSRILVRRERHANGNRHLLFRRKQFARLPARRPREEDRRVLVEVGERHPGELVHAIVLLRAVEAHVAVPLVDDVVMLGVEPARAREMAAKRVHHEVIVPREVAVARRTRVTPDVTAFRIHHRHVPLPIAADVVVVRTGEHGRTRARDGVFPVIASTVRMPRVDVGDDVILIARRVVLDETRRIERLRLQIGVGHAALGPRAVLALPAAVPRGETHLQRPVGEESPRLVEERPLVNRRMVEVALNHPLEALPMLVEHRLRRIAPRARDVRLDEHAELVRPVELARHLDLDVDAVAAEAQLLRDHDFILHELIRRERVPAFWMIALIEAKLQVNGFSVQRHVVVAVRVLTDPDLAKAKIRLDDISTLVVVRLP